MASQPEGSDFKLAGVMGWPVNHSRSPLLHGHWLRRYDIRGAYVPLKVAPQNLKEALQALPALGFAGCNLTVPHKEAALLHLDHVDPLSRRIGSVNTVVVRRDGTLEGRSTDGYGFLENLRRYQPSWRAEGCQAAIIGAGGSARAIAAVLTDARASRISIINRTKARAERLAADLGGPLAALDWNDAESVFPDCDLLVNTTTQGMVGQPPLAVDLTRLSRRAIVADIVYTPLDTPLLVQARSLGNPTVDGLGMLLHQARPGFEAWFGKAPEVDEELRSVVIRSLVG